MQRLVGQKAPVPKLPQSSSYRGKLVARKIQSDGRTTHLQHPYVPNHINSRSIMPIAWKAPTPSPEEIKAADIKFGNVANAANWKSFSALQIQTMYRIYREHLKKKMETIPVEE